MVGANYMGGKRNNARAKSKDVIGRAQRRHFGRQRLASALRVMQDSHVQHRNAQGLSSVLPQITLAHARHEEAADSSTTSVKGVIGRDRLYAPTLPGDAARRKKPSQVLGALDTLDHVSMRAAIEGILQKPNLVAIDPSMRKETAYTERVQTPVVVKPQTNVHLDAADPDTRIEVQASTRVFDPYPEVFEHEHAGLYGINPNLRCGPTKSDTFSPPNSSSGDPEVTSWDTRRDRSNTSSNAFDPLPWSRSFPLPPGSQSSDDSILNLDTSPCDAARFGRLDAHSSREDSPYMDASESSSFLPAFRRSSWSFSSQEGSAVRERQWTTSPFIDSPEEETEVERVHDFPSTESGDHRHTFPDEYGCDGIRLSIGPEVTEGNMPSGISVDFLSDPHPWETIGRILKLVSIEPSTTRSVKFDFTKDREGVGYVSGELRAYGGLHSHANSFETGVDAKPTVDIHAVSILESVALGVPHTDDRRAIGTTDFPCASNSTSSLFNGVVPSAAGEVDDVSRVQARQEASPTPAVRDDAHMRPLFPVAIAVETSSVAPVIDLTFAGPCLFGDSDLEEDG